MKSKILGSTGFALLSSELDDGSDRGAAKTGMLGSWCGLAEASLVEDVDDGGEYDGDGSVGL